MLENKKFAVDVILVVEVAYDNYTILQVLIGRGIEGIILCK